MKKFLIGTGAVIACLVILGYVFRNELQFAAMMYFMAPDKSFADSTPPAAPDYTLGNHWAALPERQDDADVSPSGSNLDGQANATVDVFFIHPTTYYSADAWNQPLDDETANSFTDDGVLKNQASVFNSCCKVYAPRYRQATLYAFMDNGEDGPAAIDFAYQDVISAFDYWLERYNQGRPFVLAGHSQGANHANRLMAERIRGTELADRMIAAYPIGYYLDGSNGIAVCESADQTGCQVTWNTVAPDAPSFRDPSTDVCVNPLTWRTDGKRADFDANLGAVSFSAAGKVEPGTTDAQCVDGQLIVTEVRSPNYSTTMFGPGNYHIYDFSFFHMNVRQNVNARVNSFMQNR